MEMTYETMYFYQAPYVKLVFTSLDITGNLWAYWFAMISCFVMGVLIEALGVLSNRMETKAKFVLKHSREPQTMTRAWVTLIFMFKLFLAYFLMLAAMTYNTCILLSAVLGFSFGYFLFGFDQMTFDLSNDGRMLSTEKEAL